MLNPCLERIIKKVFHRKKRKDRKEQGCITFSFGNRSLSEGLKRIYHNTRAFLSYFSLTRTDISLVKKDLHVYLPSSHAAID